MRLVPFLPTALILALAIACGSDDNSAAPTNTPTPTFRAFELTPQPTSAEPPPTGSDSRSVATDGYPNAPLYIALGDSLSAGVGATNRATTAFVPLVREGLGPNGLINLGHSGDDSFEITEHGHLEEALAVIEARNSDDNASNDVELVTLEIGGNDLLDIYFDLVVPGTCPNVEEGLRKPVCVNAIQDAFDAFSPNLREILAALQDADPDLPVVLMTLYNPFSGSTITAFEPIGELALEGTPGTPFPEGLNDLIRAEGEAADVTVVDIYPLFVGKGDEYIALDLIHPNDTGYRVMADAVLAALQD
jgi:lysophospholipase L1-like esterase